MKKIRIVPAIDLIDGQVVRLQAGDFGKTTRYQVSAIEQAGIFFSKGCRRLHIVDLDGAKHSQLSYQNLKVLEAIASAYPQYIIDYSGGIKDENDIKSILSAGAKKIIVGTLAVTAPHKLQQLFSVCSADELILAADVKQEIVQIKGWQVDSGITIYSLIERFIGYGGNTVMATDITKDGLLAGANIEFYRKITSMFPDVRCIASGGISSKEDIIGLYQAKVAEAIIGKALYEDRINLEEVKEYLW